MQSLPKVSHISPHLKSFRGRQCGIYPYGHHDHAEANAGRRQGQVPADLSARQLDVERVEPFDVRGAVGALDAGSGAVIVRAIAAADARVDDGR